MSCSLVSKRFRQSYKSEIIWKQLFEDIFCGIGCDKQFYDNFKNHYVLKKYLIKCSADLNTIVKCKRFLMYGENLKIMPQEVGLLTMINNLDFGLNSLDHIPSTIGKLIMLTTLNLDRNNLEYLPKEICNLPRLENLALQCNLLKTLPEEIGQLKTLLTLVIFSNKFSFLPLTLGHLTNLKILRIDENQSPLISPYHNINDTIIDTVLY
jgi:Leucine-rich repeat (LRR) protein